MAKPRSGLVHRHTPNLEVYNALGMTVRQVAYYKADEQEQEQEPAQRNVTLTQRSANEQWRGQWDPRLFERLEQEAGLAPSQQFTSALSGATLLEQSRDAGWRLTLHGEAGQPCHAWDSRASHWQTEHDELLRPVLIRETAEGQAMRVAERFSYGGEAGLNRRGRLVRHDDDAGSRVVDGYGLTGQEHGETLHFLAALDLPDWPDAALEPGAGASTRWRYGPLGQLLEQTDALGHRQSSGFTLGGELASLTLHLEDGSQHPLLVETRYNAFGQVERQSLGNQVVRHCQYDPANGRLERMQASRPGRSQLQDLLYGYDPVGNVIRIEDLSQPVRHFANQRIDPVNSFVYDSLYRLIEASGREAVGAMIGPGLPELMPFPGDTSQLLNYGQQYDYDASGNLLSLRHVGQQDYTRSLNVAPDSNRAVPAPGNPLEAFDGNGNLLQLAPGQPLQWNARNQLHSTRQVARADGDDEEHYRYGGNGLRLRKVVSRRVAGRQRRSETRYLPGLELHESEGEHLAVITVDTGHGLIRCLHWSEGQPEGIANPQLRYSLDDLHDSSGLELDGDARIISHEGYYPFGGTAWWAAGSAIEASYKIRRYSGKERDSSGLYDYGLRYYAPWLMRWINPDPAGDRDGLNRYCFVGNNPVTQRDDQGLMNTPKQPDRPGKAQREAFVEEHFTHEWSLTDDMQEDPDIPPPSPYELDSRYEPKKGEVNTFLSKFLPDKWTIKFIQKETKTNDFFASDVTLVQARMVAERFDFVGKRPSVIKYKSVVAYDTLEALSELENGSEQMKTVFLNSTSLGKLAAHIADELELTALSVTLKDEDREDGELLEASIMVALAPRTNPAETQEPATERALQLPRPSLPARVISRRHSL